MAYLQVVWKETTYLIVYSQLRRAEPHRKGRYSRRLGFCVDVIVHLEQHIKKVEIQDSKNGADSTVNGEVATSQGSGACGAGSHANGLGSARRAQ
jgi:hypothetical protein